MACNSCGSGGCGGGAFIPSGVATELVIADERDARAVADDPAPSRRWPGLDAQGLDQVKLSMLWALLSGGAYRDELVEAFAPLDEVSENGPWVFRVPPPLVSLLAGVEATRAAEVAAAWAGTEELEVDGWEPDQVRAVVEGLRGVARAAEAAKRPLLMWMSL